MEMLAWILLVVVIAPLVGAFLMGLDRRITARLQSRIGPPLTQPILDVLKLVSKGGARSHRAQLLAAAIHLVTIVVSLVMVVLGHDLLVMLFVLAFGAIALVIAGFCVRSPYSQMGAQRELMQMLAYEPLLLFMVIAIYLSTGSFMASSVYSAPQNLLLSMPLFLVTMIIVMGIKLRKSPFDTSASHHAHQELVRGLTTEFSGTGLALLEIAHWYELVLLLAITALLWTSPLWMGIAFAIAAWLVVIVIDNVSARMTWLWTLRVGWQFGVPLSLANIALLYAIR